MNLRAAQRPRVAALLAALLAALAVPVPPASAEASLMRIAGPHRFATAVALADAAFPGGVRTAVIASGIGFPDALAAAYLAGAQHAPVFLVPRDGDASDATNAMRRLGVRDATVVGGPAAIGEGVRAQIASTGATIRTIAGADRFDTASRVAGEAPPVPLDGAVTAILASGESFPDALAASGPSFANRLPILLTRRADLPSSTESALDAMGARRVIVVGGPAAVAPEVLDRLAAKGIATERLAGATRTSTASAVAIFAAERLAWVADGVVLANGQVFPDALAAAPLSGLLRQPVLLSESATALGEAARSFISTRSASMRTVRVVGGPAAVSDDVAADAVAASPPPGGSSASGSGGGSGVGGGGGGGSTGDGGGGGGGSGVGGGGGGGSPTTTVPTTTSTSTTSSTTTTSTTSSTTTTSTTTTTTTTTTSTTTTTIPACPASTPPVAPAPPERSLLPPAPELPVFHGESPRGRALTQPLTDSLVTAKVVDGAAADWVAPAPGYGGSVRYACGELVYTDHLFDAYGADDGGDTKRLAVLDPLNENRPETYRLDPVFQVDAPGELGIPTDNALNVLEGVIGPGSLNFAKAEEQYGDAGHQDVADLVELRVAADATNVHVYARTTTMASASQPALLLLLDSTPGATSGDVGFASQLTTTRADIAVLVTGAGATARNIATGATTALTAAVNPAGFDNAIEVALPRSLLGAGTAIDIAAATGRAAEGGGALFDLATAEVDLPNVANVAFRTAEPVRTWFEKRQALELAKGAIDAFFLPVDLTKLTSGFTEAWSPGPGYHERVFRSTTATSAERGLDGVFQHYGVYVPTTYSTTTPNPMTLWMHWRGGKAHSAAAVSPRIMRDQGENLGRVVVAPRGRGTATWYLGNGQADFLEVWDDAFGTLNLDANRVYVTGHSMGGWASYLLPTIYPDRFAAAFPVDGPVTQGAFVAVDTTDAPPPSQLPSSFRDRWDCDDYRWPDEDFDEYTPCYVDTNDGDARIQHTLKLLRNLHNVPIAIYQGALDELVPIGGTSRQVLELARMQYRHRYYVFPTYEHYTHPIVDEWAAAARYAHAQTRNPNPPRVVYRRDMPFECTVNIGPDVTERDGDGDLVRLCRGKTGSDAAASRFKLDRAYWMSELTPAPTVATADFDGRSRGIPEPTVAPVPEAGGPADLGQVGPFVMTGLMWLPMTTPALSNEFSATLAGAAAVKLDTVRMNLDATQVITGAITIDRPLALHLVGNWAVTPTVANATIVSHAGGVLTLSVPASATVTITP